MIDLYLKYDKVSTVYQNACDVIGCMFAMEDGVVFDFDNNCVRFADDSSALLLHRYYNRVRLLRNELDELGKLIDRQAALGLNGRKED